MAFGDSSLGEAVLELRADGNPLERDINDAHQRASGLVGRLGSMIGGTLKTGLLVAGAATVAGIAGLVTVASSSLASAIDVQKIGAQTDAVIASTKGIAGVTKQFVEETADSLSKLVGVDDDAVQSAQNLLLTFTGIGKDVFPQATKSVVDMATAMNGGAIPTLEQMQSTTLQIGKALNDFSGYTALKRAGVSFTDEQIKLIEHFKKTNDLASYQKLVLKELETEFGKAGAAAGQTFAGKMARLQTVVGNVQEKIGGALLPTVTNLLTKFLDFADSPEVEAWTDGLVDGIQNVLQLLVDLIGFASSGDISDVFADLTKIFGEENARHIADFLDGIEGIIRLLITGDFTGGIFGLSEDDDWIGALFAARDAVIGIIEWVQKLVGAIARGDWGAVWNTLVSGAQGALSTLLTTFADWAPHVWDWLTGAVGQIGAKLGEFINGIASWIEIHGPDKWQQLLIWADNFWDWLTGENGALAQAPTKISDAASQIGGEVEKQWTVISAKLSEWGTKFWDWLTGEGGALAQLTPKMKEFGEGLNAWADTEGSKLFEDFGERVGTALADAVASFFGSEEGKSKNDDIITAFIMGLGEALLNVGEVLDKIATAFVTGLANAIYKKLTGKEMSDALKQMVGDAVGQAMFGNLRLGGQINQLYSAQSIPKATSGLGVAGGIGTPIFSVNIDGTEIKNATLGVMFDETLSMFGDATAAAAVGH